nr:hypothetical protein BN167_500031 [Clostridioides difficile E13]
MLYRETLEKFLLVSNENLKYFNKDKINKMITFFHNNILNNILYIPLKLLNYIYFYYK